MSNITIVSIDINYTFPQKRSLYAWIETILKKEGKSAGTLMICLCSDAYLLDMNKQFLQHDYYTDIITFDYSGGDLVSGELYISLDRVKENAKEFGVSTREELNRIIAHGILHLCGYKDKKKSDIELMRKKEQEMLSLLS